jgi:hypothetical protein
MIDDSFIVFADTALFGFLGPITIVDIFYAGLEELFLFFQDFRDFFIIS